MQAVRGRARQLRDRWVDQTLVRVERARGALARGAGDLLVLGESSCLAWAHSDTDRRLIPDLIAERTGSSVVTIAGPGYDARMFDAVLRVLGLLDQRPKAVVMAVNVRTNTADHVTRHPLYGHDRARAALGRISAPVRRVRAFAHGGSTSRRRDVREFRALQVTTRWGGTGTIGRRLSRLEGLGPPPWPVDLERLRFDYFHGQVVNEENCGLAALARLGPRLAEYGVPVVAYWAQPPVAQGARLFPNEFVPHLQGNLGLVESALGRDALGPPGLLRPALDDADFQDYRNGTEHYSFTGRRKVAEDVARALALIGH